MNSFDNQIIFALSSLLTPWGLALVGGFMAAIVFVMATRDAKWVALTVLLYVCTVHRTTHVGMDQLATSVDIEQQNVYGATSLALIAPLQKLDEFGRPACVALLTMLAIAALRNSSEGWNRKLIGAAVAYGAFELICGGRDLFGESATSGAFSILVYATTFVALGIGVSRWVQTIQDLLTVIRCMAVTGLIFVLLSLIQFAVNSSGAIWLGRFAGTSWNANGAGTVLVMALLPTSYLIMRRGERRALKCLWIVSALLMLVMIGWTGSRGPLLALIIGALVLLRLRPRNILLALVLCALGAGIAILVLPGAVDSASRLLSVEDTRTAAWTNLLGIFLDHPLFGAPAGGESLYLFIAANYGLLGLAPFVVFLGLLLRSLYRLWRLRPMFGDNAGLVDLILAAVASILVGSLFDGWLQALFVLPSFCMYLYMAIAGFLLQCAEHSGMSPEARFSTTMEEAEFGPPSSYFPGQIATDQAYQ